MTGRELDAQIAVKIFGLKLIGPEQVENSGGFPEPLLPYSSDLVAAWEVVDKFAREGDVFLSWSKGDWSFRIQTLRATIQDSGKSAPLAICKAALRATER